MQCWQVPESGDQPSFWPSAQVDYSRAKDLQCSARLCCLVSHKYLSEEERMENRREMQVGDWANGAAIFAVGVFLGLAIYHLAQLVGTAFWPLIVIIPVLFGGVFLLNLKFDNLIDRIFPNGIKPARKPHAKQRKPLVLLLSLPTGIIIGVIGAMLGLGDVLL